MPSILGEKLEEGGIGILNRSEVCVLKYKVKRVIRRLKGDLPFGRAKGGKDSPFDNRRHAPSFPDVECESKFRQEICLEESSK